MFRRRIGVCAALLVLIAVLASPVAAGAAPANRVEGLAASRPSLMEIWSWVRSLVPLRTMVGESCDAGSSIDPNGTGCVDVPTAAAPNVCGAGTMIDPNGSCRNLPTATGSTACGAGSSIDPNGECRDR
jgi:hypothetical protein